MGIRHTGTNWYNPDVINPSILAIVKAGIFPELGNMTTSQGWTAINYKQPNNSSGLEAYLDPNTPGYQQQGGVDGINPSTLQPGNYTATLIVQIPGKDNGGNDCVIDYPIERSFEVTGPIAPNIAAIPHHFDIENDIPTSVTNVPADATAVSCTLDGVALSVNWTPGQTTASANL